MKISPTDPYSTDQRLDRSQRAVELDEAVGGMLLRILGPRVLGFGVAGVGVVRAQRVSVACRFRGEGSWGLELWSCRVYVLGFRVWVGGFWSRAFLSY